MAEISDHESESTSDENAEDKTKKEKILNHSELILASLGFLVACISLGVAIDQGIKARQHNELSVQPILNFEYRNRNNAFEIFIANNGLGTAVIKKYDTIYNDRKIKNMSSAMENVILSHPHKKVEHLHAFYRVGGAIPINKKSQIFHVDFNEFSEIEVKEIKRVLNNIHIDVEYTSVYRTKTWAATTR